MQPPVPHAPSSPKDSYHILLASRVELRDKRGARCSLYRTQPENMFRAKIKLSNDYPTCLKHPKHKQSPGVCSICLNQKLSNLSTTTSSSSRPTRRKAPSYSSSSSLSSLSSSDISSCVSSHMSPVRAIQMRVDYEARASKYSYNWDKLSKRSDSMAIFGRPVHQKEGEKNNDFINSVEKKKRSGFWSKLLTNKHRRTRTILNDHQHNVDRVTAY